MLLADVLFLSVIIYGYKDTLYAQFDEVRLSPEEKTPPKENQQKIHLQISS